MDWQRYGPYCIRSNTSPAYCVTRFMERSSKRFMAYKAEQYLAGPFSTAKEAMAVCENNYLILHAPTLTAPPTPEAMPA